jgi:hypothetical protein
MRNFHRSILAVALGLLMGAAAAYAAAGGRRYRGRPGRVPGYEFPRAIVPASPLV